MSAQLRHPIGDRVVQQQGRADPGRKGDIELDLRRQMLPFRQFGAGIQIHLVDDGHRVGADLERFGRIGAAFQIGKQAANAGLGIFGLGLA